ncbi:MAG: hypothetical protein A2271_04660 [Candidatus Moranbacteria bacterium RIFOXYA12_FULL_35_19]|nr:MAG: hypothetical protein UR78_C0001G0058 [Candidatus Moranbacteria bacterium GW2011_GWF2_35_39]OGI31917.1 MAG: hypothetical protein A2343_04255 [Candidatus Moranbacteria bacterium RIFOXYB12_FULL_35_8]OGI35730.1 MAG: hypothetical protein A2271_04660 [Candidatus Moranbacteria bacterium RIFOXYA12_FULL_35_19]
MKKRVIFIGIIISIILFGCGKNHDDPEIKILEELNSFSAQITNAQKDIPEEEKCELNSDIKEFNLQREKYLISPTFMKKEMLPQKIELFNIQCP